MRYILRDREETHVGLFVERLTRIADDGRETEVWRVVLDEEHYTPPAQGLGYIMKRAMTPGVISTPRPPLQFTEETRTRRMFAASGGVR